MRNATALRAQSSLSSTSLRSARVRRTGAVSRPARRRSIRLSSVTVLICLLNHGNLPALEYPDTPPNPETRNRAQLSMRLAQVTVEGEVLTVDPAGEPRLWGRGRPNLVVNGLVGNLGPCVNDDINYGLTDVMVDWGSAAQACPAGTWVCRRDEIITCDTNRFDSASLDGRDCDGTGLNFPSNNHHGWVADAVAGGFDPQAKTEGAASPTTKACVSLPVWCCWR